jgi:hypothetical protein
LFQYELFLDERGEVARSLPEIYDAIRREKEVMKRPRYALSGDDDREFAFETEGTPAGYL